MRKPSSDRVPGIAPADLAACRAMLASGSRTFHAAGRVLPPRIAASAVALYAFCRVADDDVDFSRPDERRDAITALRTRLDRVYAARPVPLPPDRAMAAIVAAHGVPRALPEALLDGFAWDAENRRYETLSELLGYAARVAGTVGAMMTVIMGRRDPVTLARACELGCAMQLSNIARDVGEDARAGRLYLPLSWMRQEGVCPDAFLARPAHSPALGRVVRRLLDAADALYRRAAPGIARLPRGCRPAIFAARHLYAAIGDAVRAADGDAVTARAVVGGRGKVAVLARAALAAAYPSPSPARKGKGAVSFSPLLEGGAGGGVTIPELAFLVAAAMSAGPPPARRPPPRTVAGQVVFVATLFDKLAKAPR